MQTIDIFFVFLFFLDSLETGIIGTYGSKLVLGYKEISARFFMFIWLLTFFIFVTYFFFFQYLFLDQFLLGYELFSLSSFFLGIIYTEKFVIQKGNFRNVSIIRSSINTFIITAIIFIQLAIFTTERLPTLFVIIKLIFH